MNQRKSKIQLPVYFVGLVLICFSQISFAVSRAIDIDAFDKTELGSTDTEIENLFGKPTVKLDVLEGPDKGSQVWIYREQMNLDGKSVFLDRLKLSFDKNQKKVVSKHFDIYEDEKFSKLDQVLGRYKNFNLAIFKPQFCGHIQVTDTARIDSKNGFGIGETSSGQVSSLSRWQPDRAPSAEADLCAKAFSAATSK